MPHLSFQFCSGLFLYLLTHHHNRNPIPHVPPSPTHTRIHILPAREYFASSDLCLQIKFSMSSKKVGRGIINKKKAVNLQTNIDSVIKLSLPIQDGILHHLLRYSFMSFSSALRFYLLTILWTLIGIFLVTSLFVAAAAAAATSIKRNLFQSHFQTDYLLQKWVVFMLILYLATLLNSHQFWVCRFSWFSIIKKPIVSFFSILLQVCPTYLKFVLHHFSFTKDLH